MDRKTWTVEVNGTQHEVALNWTYYGGARQVQLDGKVVADDTKPMRWKSEQTIQVDGTPVVVRTRPTGKISPYFFITCEVDGQAVPPTSARLARWEKAA